MSSPPRTIGLVGDGPVALAYSEAVRQTTGLAPVVAPVEALLNDSTITAIIVATPAAGRAAAAALDSGKNVLLDPSAMGSRHGIGQVPATARTGDGSLLIARPWRFHEVCRSLRAAVDRPSGAPGDLGPPAFFQWVSEGATTRTADEGAESTAAVQTIVGLDLALWLLGGQPARVFARPVGSDGATISIRFASGANALLEQRTQLATPGTSYGFAWLLGPRGEARWEQRADDLVIDRSGAHFTPLDFRPCLAAATMHAIARWRNGADLAAEADETRRLLATFDAVRESIRLEQPVDLQSLDEDVRR